MNLFKVLNGGNSSIREVSMTAILGYFLDEYQDHALGNQLLLELISTIDEIPNNIKEKYRRSETLIESENIDTVIKFFQYSQDNNQEEFHRVIIENKIQNSAANEEQLVNYYTSQRNNTNVPITVLFITHENPSQKTLNEFQRLAVNDGDSSKHIFWYESNNENENSRGSIHQLLLNLITKEYKAEIDPIHGYILQTIKAFARHLESFSSTSKASVPSDELERRDSYEIIDRLERLKQELGNVSFQGNEVWSSEIDSTSDLRFPRFYYNLPETGFKVSLQYSNREDPQARILLRPENNDRQGRKNVRKLCDYANTDSDLLLFKKNGEYANIADRTETGKLNDIASKKLSQWQKEEMTSIFKKYIHIVEGYIKTT